MIFDIISSCGTIIAILALAYQWYKDRRERKEWQARSVSAWIKYEPFSAVAFVNVSNQSNLPIYEVVISIDPYENDIQTGRKCTVVQCIPPGIHCYEVPFQLSGMHMKFGASLSFRDCFENAWTRKSNGKMVQDKLPPVTEPAY